MNQEEFGRRLAAKKAKEAEISASFATAPDDQILELLYEFIACKYLLDPEDMSTDDLIALGERSTAKIAGFQKDGLEFREKSAGCTTASSGVIKKVLLAIAVGTCIGARLDPDRVAAAETVPQLAELIVHTRAGGA